MEFENFKVDAFHLKTQNVRLLNENNILKEKLKKLEESIDIKHSIIDSLVDPKKSIQIRNQNTSYISSLREENEKLKEEVRAKTFLIKKLYHDLDYTKSFITKTARINKFAVQSIPQPQCIVRNKEFAKEMTRATSESKKKRGKSPTGLHIDNKAVTADYPFRYPDSPKYLRSTTPLEEIQQLHTYFTGIVEEVKNLKESIFKIQNTENKKPLEEKKKVDEPLKNIEINKPTSRNTNQNKPNRNKKHVVKKIFKASKNIKNGESSSSSVCIQMQNNINKKRGNVKENNIQRLEEMITKLQ